MSGGALGAAPFVVAACAFLFQGCGDEPREFRVAEVTPGPANSTLHLNEPITLRFSEPVDPSSVTLDSVRVVGKDRRIASGRLIATGDHVTFVPKPVAAASLDDGGFAPGERVEVAVFAFPKRDGVLSTGGEPLRRPFKATFDVVGVEAAESSNFAAFVDTEPGEKPHLSNLDRLHDGAGDAVIHPDGSVILAFNKPLAPRTVDSNAIDLRYDNHDRTPVETETRLIQYEDRAEIRIRPTAGFQPRTRYLLIVKSGRLRDLVGNLVEDVPPLALRAEETGALQVGAMPVATGN